MWSTRFLWLLVLLSGRAVESIPQPSSPITTVVSGKSALTGTTTNNNNNNNCPSVFGVSSKKSGNNNNNNNPLAAAAAADISRGGGAGGGGHSAENTVLEPSTLEAVEAILIRAGSSQSLVVIDFSATWCGPCKAIAPLFQELCATTKGVVFVKVDVDENPDTAAKYSVSAMPTFIFIKNGDVVDRLMGANPSRLQDLINEHK